MRDNTDRLLTDRLNEITLLKQENTQLKNRVHELEQLMDSIILVSKEG